MLTAFHHEEAVQAGEDRLRLVLDFAAIDAIEGLAARGFDKILVDLTAPAPPLALQGKVVWGLLRRHHPEISIDQVAGLLFGDVSVAIGVAIGKLINAAFPPVTPEAKGARPLKPRGRSKPSSSRGAPSA